MSYRGMWDLLIKIVKIKRTCDKEGWKNNTKYLVGSVRSIDKNSKSKIEQVIRKNEKITQNI